MKCHFTPWKDTHQIEKVLKCIHSLFSDKWSPALQIRTVLLSIQALLSAPNPDDPLANDVAEQWKLDETNAIKIGEWEFGYYWSLYLFFIPLHNNNTIWCSIRFELATDITIYVVMRKHLFIMVSDTWTNDIWSFLQK